MKGLHYSTTAFYKNPEDCGSDVYVAKLNIW